MDENESNAKINFDGSSFIKINPAIDFVNGVAYFGLVLPAYVLKEIESSIETVEENYPFLITSKLENFPADANSLAKRKIILIGDVSNLETRWSLKSIKDFLNSWSEILDFDDVLTEIKETLETFIEFPEPEWATVVALYIIATYFHQIFEAFGILYISGTKRSGKSKLGNIISNLGFNGIKSGSITPSAMYRTVQNLRATFVIDEAEKFGEDTEKAQLLKTILLNGYKKGSRVLRSADSKKNFELEFFETYSPKVICNISGISLEPLEDRTITLTMLTGTNREIINRELPGESENVWGDVRDKLYTLTMQKFEDVKELSGMIAVPEFLSAREWENWKPIFVVASLCKKIDFDKFQEFVKQIVGVKATEQESESLDVSVLKAVETFLIAGEKEWVSIKELTDTTNAIEGRAEKESYGTKTVGRVLKRLGFEGKDYKRRVSTGREYRFPLKDFLDRCRRLNVEVSSELTEKMKQERLDEVKK